MSPFVIVKFPIGYYMVDFKRSGKFLCMFCLSSATQYTLMLISFKHQFAFLVPTTSIYSFSTLPIIVILTYLVLWDRFNPGSYSRITP